MRSSLLSAVLLVLATTTASATPISTMSGSPAPSHAIPALHDHHQKIVDSGCDHAQVRRRLEERAARRHQYEQKQQVQEHQEQQGARISDGQPLDKRQDGSYGDGASVSPSGGASSANYKCDPSKCKLPDCLCASTTPPGNLDSKDVPMFITLTRYGRSSERLTNRLTN